MPRLRETSNALGTMCSNLRNHRMPPWSGATCREPADAVAMARTFLPGLPDKRDQAVPGSLRIGFLARQCSSQEVFLDQDPPHEGPDGNAGQQSRGVRVQPQRHADQQGDGARLHRMSHQAVDSALDHSLLSFFPMLHYRCREGILP